MSSGLSARQEECLRLTAFLTDKEIATRLGLSEATVKKHVHEACRRLGVNRRKAALARLTDPDAARVGGTPPPPPVPAAATPKGRIRAARLLLGLMAAVVAVLAAKTVIDLTIAYARQARAIDAHVASTARPAP